MRFNLDTFNAAYSVLDDDQEKAQFLTGFSRGLNGAAARDGAPEAHSSGFLIGSGMRQEAVLASARGAEFAKRKGTQRGPSGDPEGTHGGPSGEGVGLPEGPGLRIKDCPSQEVPVPRLEPVPTRKPRSERKPLKAASSLDEMLGELKAPYWKLVSTFGGPAKNPAPKTTAQLYTSALAEEGITAEILQAKAEGLKASCSDPKFMPMLRTWLDGQGYLNPDAPSAGSAPAHRRESDEEYAAFLERGQIGA